MGGSISSKMKEVMDENMRKQMAFQKEMQGIGVSAPRAAYPEPHGSLGGSGTSISPVYSRKHSMFNWIINLIHAVTVVGC